MPDPLSGQGGEIRSLNVSSPLGTAEITQSDYGSHLPLVDPNALAALEAAVDGPAIAQRFARDYTDMWEARLRRLVIAVEARDRATALDILINLKNSSKMVGGLRLSCLAEHLEQTLRHAELSDPFALMAAVTDQGNQTVKELKSTYIAKNSHD